MELTEIECADVEWIRMTQDRIQWRILVDTAMKMEFCLKTFWALKYLCRVYNIYLERTAEGDE
jgi:hypothetical protein